VPFGFVELSNPNVASLNAQAEYKLDLEANWQPISFSEGSFISKTNVLQDNSDYEFRARFRTLTNTAGDWTPIETISVVADETPPLVVSSVSATGGIGIATINWTTPNSANYSYTIIRRSLTNDINTAIIVRTEYGAPNASDSWQDTVSANTYYYWLQASNASGVTASAVATGAVVVI
jgi:hypothetical protein